MDAVPIVPPLFLGTKTRHFTSYKQATDHALLTRGGAGAAVLIVDRERRKLRRNYAKLSQPKPMKAGAAPALQLLDLL